MVRWMSLALIVLLNTSTAKAERGTDAEQRAYEAFERGERLFQAEDYLGAAEQFEEAFRLVPTAAVHYNIARSYELAGLPGLAIEHYQAFLEARAGSPRRQRLIRQRLARLRERVGWVVIDTHPPLARITIDGRDRGIAPVRVPLARGTHQVEAQLDVATTIEEITVEGGQDEQTITLTLVAPEPEPEEPETFEPREAPSVEGERGGEPTEERRGIGRLHHAVFWVGLGLTLGSGVALAIYGAELFEKSDLYESLPSGDPREDELYNEGVKLQTITTALWISTGVLAAVTGLIAIFTDWSALRPGRSREPQSFRLDVGVGSVALTLSY